jgi:RNA polymerase sigma-70 factor (ECF subfamily)
LRAINSAFLPMPDLVTRPRGNGDSGSSTGTSRSLIDRLQADDAGALDRLVQLYAPLVAHWCRGRGLAEADSADVFQEVFRSVAAHVSDFRRNRAGDTFRGWLRTITVNKIHDFYRKRSREPRAVGGSEALRHFALLPDPAGDEVSSAGASSIAPPADDDAAVERRLFLRGLELVRSEFEPRTWQAFWLTAVEGRTAKEAAAELSMTPGAVRVAKSRLLQRLREELGDVSEA